MLKDIHVGNENANIAICTFWSDKEQLVKELDSKQYAIIGNLYSSNGINFLLQTLLRNPDIKYLVLWGSSLVSSDLHLLNLWERGVQDGFIPDTKIRILIEKQYIDILRKNVQLIDLQKQSADQVAAKLKEISGEEKPYGKPIEINFLHESKVSTIPSQVSGHYLYEEDAYAAWLKALNYVMNFGVEKITEKKYYNKEYLNLLITVPKISKKLNAKASLLELDIAPILSELEKNPYSHRASAAGITFTIIHDKVMVSYEGKSVELYKELQGILLGLEQLQKKVCERLNKELGTTYGLGSITVHIVNAYIEEKDWDKVYVLVKDSKAYIERLNLDPKGNYIIFIENKKIVVEYRSIEGELIEKFSGTNGQKLYKKIASADFFSFHAHAAYLGYELGKAESCLKKGEAFRQDEA